MQYPVGREPTSHSPHPPKERAPRNPVPSALHVPLSERGRPLLWGLPRVVSLAMMVAGNTHTWFLHQPALHPPSPVQRQISEVPAHRGPIQPEAYHREIPSFSSHLLWKSLESHSLRLQRRWQYSGNNHQVSLPIGLRPRPEHLFTNVL